MVGAGAGVGAGAAVLHFAAMRIVYATMQFGRGYSQGTERYLTILSAEMRRRGHETFVLAGDPERRGGRAALGERVGDEPVTLAYPSHGWMSVVGMSPGWLVGLLRELRPELVHLVNPGHIGVGICAAARELGVPTVATIVDYWWHCPKHTLLRSDNVICAGNRPASECAPCIAADRPGSKRESLARVPLVRSMMLPVLYAGRWLAGGVPLGEVRNWMNRPGLLRHEMNLLDGIIFLSQAARRRFEPLLSKPRTTVIYNGLETEWFADSPSARNAPRGEGEGLVLGYAGALAAHKGVHLILEALRELKWGDVRLRIAGGGEAEYEARLREAARGLQVEFVGRVPPGEMPGFLRSLDALIVPSVWPENLPMVVFEAYASGIEVLGSNVDGIAEIVGDPECLFDVNSAASLAARLRAWREAPRGQRPHQVHRAVEMADATAAFYEQVRGLAKTPS